MKSQRRLGADTAKNRELLINAAEQVLRQEGYAAITARRVAEEAKLKVQLVYYYFEAMDDLILAVVRKITTRRLERFARIVASPEPFRALWELHIDPATAISTSELLALANHDEKIRAEIVASARQFRSLETEAVSRMLALKGVDQAEYPPAAIVTIVTALARAMVQDTALGVSDGYADAVKVVERGLDFFRHQSGTNRHR